MGYKQKARIYNLVFDDPDLDGLEVRCRSVSVGKMRRITSDDPSIDKVDELLTAFAEALDRWNLEDDDGQPVPATAAGMDTLDIDFLMPIMNAWVEAVSGVPDELGKDSTSGAKSLVASIPMETLSLNRAS